MSRLQRKCVIASASLHILLCGLLIFTAAFSKSEPQEMRLNPIRTFDAKLIDGPTAGGGNPTIDPGRFQEPEPPAPEPPPPTPPPAPKPVVQPEPDPVPEQPTPVIPKPGKIEPVKNPTVPAVVPKPVKPAPRPTPVRKSTPPKPEVKETSKKTEPKPATPRKPIQVDLDKPKTINADAQRQAREKAQAEQEAAARRNLAKTFGRSIDTLNKRGSSGVAIESPGTGGEAFVNYADLVFTIYDRAWINPRDGADSDAKARAEIVVERSGRVHSARIISKSGIPALDKSVQTALDRVKELPPFPGGARDNQRTFIINFSLQARRLNG